MELVIVLVIFCWLLTYVSDQSDAANDDQSTRAGHIVQAISAEELQDLMDQFTYLMQQRFLLGEDGEHLDYSKIDNDEALDDHWQREANYDAEEKYFEEDWYEWN